MMRAYLVDDEQLALKRLERMLRETERVDVMGVTTDPERAMAEIELLQPDVLFLDIQMPELTGFELLSRLSEPPLVVFVTAYDRYALKAFEVNSIDYLLKPVEQPQLERALAKLERMLASPSTRPALDALVRQVKEALQQQQPAQRAEPLERIASKIGERVHLVELTRVTHFYAEDKLTYAATPEKNWVVDRTIAELERKLDPLRFVRVHRSTVVNLDYVDELFPWFGGKMVLRLKDPKRTEISVARDRLKELKERLGI